MDSDGGGEPPNDEEPVDRNNKQVERRGERRGTLAKAGQEISFMDVLSSEYEISSDEHVKT
jgi:hypothetical protein